jgi:hypothetical protein
MIDKEALRTTILAETDSLGQKRRFGLFSHPISTAVGDDGEYKIKFRKWVSMQMQGRKEGSL